MKYGVLALMLVGGAALSGCSSTPGKSDTESSSAVGEVRAASAGARTGGRFEGDALPDGTTKKVFYFPFDSTEVSAADRAALLAHAKFLAANPKVKVVIEGNCDERGTREYNLALGERRAQAIQRLLLLQGAGQANLEAISFGQEKPVALCHDESCWHLNRRVELNYTGS